MRCAICKKSSDETKLFEGISKAGMINICNECSESEGIPIIKKPSESQLNKADERFSVRERMERMSGRHETTEISKDQIVTQGNLAKLRMPAPKQHHKDVMDNYYWTLNIARRRKKFSISQLAEKMRVAPQLIQSIEKGKLPENFTELFLKLEAFLRIKLLKNHKTKINFIRTKDEEQEILKNVRKKMGSIEIEDDIAIDSGKNTESIKEYKEDEREFKEKLSKGKIDFSRREDLANITLNDLVDMKKKKEKQKAKSKEDAMLGDDLDLDLELL